jgi:hypothetical protein
LYFLHDFHIQTIYLSWHLITADFLTDLMSARKCY